MHSLTKNINPTIKSTKQRRIINEAMGFNVTPAASVVLCFLMASLYVMVLYMIPAHIRKMNRDHTKHILARFASVTAVCFTCPFLLHRLYSEQSSPLAFHHWLGFRSAGIVPAAIVPTLLTGFLFLGPIVESLLMLRIRVKESKHHELSLRPWNIFQLTETYAQIRFEPLPSIRSYIMGPLTEEFVFRCCMLPLLIYAKFSILALVFASTLFFGVAHLHHAYEFIRQGKTIPQALLIVALQLCYTSIFGAYANFVFLRTGHFLSVFLCHALCNVMGLPTFSFLQAYHPLRDAKLVIGVFYVVGVYAFSSMLFPLTSPDIYSSQLWATTINVISS